MSTITTAPPAMVATHMVLVAVLDGSARVQSSDTFGGETLLGRSLVAASKSAIADVTIVCTAAERARVESMVETVRHRITASVAIEEIEERLQLLDAIRRAAETWTEPFLIVEADKILHPSMLRPSTRVAADSAAVLIGYDHVSLEGGRVLYDTRCEPKYRVIHRDCEHLTKIRLLGLEDESGAIVSRDLREGRFSTGILVCRREDLAHLPPASDVDSIVERLNERRALAFAWVGNAWWFQPRQNTSRALVDELFWNIAFKDISGEFSKTVNSRLSKPLTFLFVRWGWTPNAVSGLMLLLFLAASVFLAMPGGGTLVAFAAIWQFAAGVLDRCDGETARVRNYESDRGADFDVILDDVRFMLPLAVLCGVRLTAPPLNVFPITIGCVALASAIGLAVLEIRLMHRTGFRSRQVTGIAVMKTLARGRAWVRTFHRIRPWLKGDIRTFYITVLCVSGSRDIVFWALIVNAFFMGALSIATMAPLRRRRLASQLSVSPPTDCLPSTSTQTVPARAAPM